MATRVQVTLPHTAPNMTVLFGATLTDAVLEADLSPALSSFSWLSWARSLAALRDRLMNLRMCLCVCLCDS